MKQEQRTHQHHHQELLKQALDLSVTLGDIANQAKLHWNLMLNYLFSNRMEEALEHCEPTIGLARQAGDIDQLAFDAYNTVSSGAVLDGTIGRSWS